MPRKNLTARFIDSVKVDQRCDYWDAHTPGLVFRVTPTGAKSWSTVYSRESDRKKRRFTLGAYPAISLERARKLALQALTDISNGQDPAGKKASNRSADTVIDLAALFIEKHCKPNRKTWREDQRIFNSDILPKIGEMKGNLVRKRDILDVIEAKAETGKIRQANVIRTLCMTFFNWVVDHDYLETSPAVGIRTIGKATRRERIFVTQHAKLTPHWGDRRPKLTP